MDWDKSEKDQITFQGDIYRGDNQILWNLPQLTPPFVSRVGDHEDFSGGNLIGRWNHKISNDSSTTLQLYYDNTDRDNDVIHDWRNTFDIDFQHLWTLNDTHQVIWGAGYRYSKDEMDATQYISLTPDSRGDNLFSAFVQDKITLSPDRWFLTLGSKFERNDYTGFEIQPSGRLAWLISEGQTWWASASRAIRSASRSQDDVSIVLIPFPQDPTLGYVNRIGSRDVDSEKMVALETGYRIQPNKKVSFDVAGYYNIYDKLTAGALGAPFPTSFNGSPPYLIFPVLPVNDDKAKAYGLEFSTNWSVTDKWQLMANYTWMHLNFKKADPFGFSFDGKSPRHQVNLRSTYALSDRLEMNNMFYFVDDLDAINIDGYLRFDTSIIWKVVDGIEFSLVGQNLLDPRHPEFSPFLYNSPTEIGRSYYGMVTWRF